VKSDPFHSVESLTVQIPPAVGPGRRVNSPKTYPRGGRRDRFAFRLLEPIREKVESDESVVIPWSVLLLRRRTDVESRDPPHLRP